MSVSQEIRDAATVIEDMDSEWFEKINEYTLDLESYENCVIGQVFYPGMYEPGNWSEFHWEIHNRAKMMDIEIASNIFSDNINRGENYRQQWIELAKEKQAELGAR